jgi:Flp pilus assembly protein TadD
LLSQDESPAQADDPGRSELVKATEYWAKEYAKEPRNLDAALSYAKNLKAMGEKKRALSVLQQASVFHGNSRDLASEYGRIALEFDQIGLAGRLLAAADDPTNPDWRVISARGTVLAKQGKYQDAIPYYERALVHAHDHPSILSNLALAHAMNGEPKRAEAMLRQAAATDRNSLKIRQNLALVLGLQGKYDEAKLLASHDLSAENAAENTDYLRRIVKLEPNKPPVGKAKDSVAQARAPSTAPTVEADDDDETDAQSAAAQTSELDIDEQDAKAPVQTGGILRGTMPAVNTAADAEAAQQEPREAPSFETNFSIAQWSPQTVPAPAETVVNVPAATSTASKAALSD